MRVVVTESRSDDYTYASLEIVLDEKIKFHVSSSEDSPEDNTLDRNFSDCYNITMLLQKAYEAGLNGEELVIEYTDEEDEF